MAAAAQAEYLRFNWLVPGRLAGGTHPDLSDGLENITGFLRERGVGGIVTLYEEPLDPSPEEFGFRYLFVETPNYQPPTNLDQILAFIDAELESGHAVVVHCFAGIGRTGVVLAAWLLRHHPELSAAEAIERVLRDYIPEYAQSRFPESPEQRESLEQFARTRASS